MNRRRVPGLREYPGKIFIWSDESEARLLALVGDGVEVRDAAEILNREFKQRVKLTASAVCGKAFRLRKRGTEHD